MSKAISAAAIAIALITSPVFAQTAAGPAAETTTEAAPAAPQSQPDTTLPGVTDSATTGSTTTGNAAQATGQERCQAPGTTSDSNPTGGVPSLAEANPACR